MGTALSQEIVLAQFMSQVLKVGQRIGRLDPRTKSFILGEMLHLFTQTCERICSFMFVDHARNIYVK